MAPPPVLEWIAHLRDPSVYRRRQAAHGLAQAAGAAPELKAAAADGLRAVLSDPNKYVRIAAARSLAIVAPESAPFAVERLIELIRDDHRDVRIAALQALPDLGPAAAAARDLLAETAERDPLPALRRQAAAILAALPPPAAG